jgi:hypothetical protein
MDTRTVELGPAHELTIEVAVALANVFRLQGKAAEAEVTLRKVCELNAAIKGEDHEDTILALGTLSRVLVDRGQFDEAEHICHDLLASLEAKYGPNDRRTIEALVTLSQLADLRCDSDTVSPAARPASPPRVNAQCVCRRPPSSSRAC